jgi:SAM-dependent methyltransferase
MVRTALRRFRDANVKLSWMTTPSQLWEVRGFAIYEWVARALLGRAGANVVVDVGGGRTWHFGDDYWRNPDFRLIGVDVDAGELALNPKLDQAITADICETLGVPDGSVDLVLCRAVVEHLHDTSAFLDNVSRALRPGGSAAFVFANKWSPPMILNRIIPPKLAGKLLLALVPGTAGYGGFRAYYDKCSFSAFKRELLKRGFEIEYEYASYYSSSYFQFFWPLHVVSIVLDLVRQSLSIRDLSQLNLFVVRKPAPATS